MEFANKEVSVSDAITDAHTGEAARSPLQQAPLEGQKLRTLLEEAKAVRAKAYEAPPSHFIMEVEKGWWQSTPHLFEWWISFESMVTPEWVEEIEAVHDEQQVEDLVALQEAHQGRFNANAIGGRGNVQARHMVILWVWHLDPVLFRAAIFFVNTAAFPPCLSLPLHMSGVLVCSSYPCPLAVDLADPPGVLI